MQAFTMLALDLHGAKAPGKNEFSAKLKLHWTFSSRIAGRGGRCRTRDDEPFKRIWYYSTKLR